MGSNLAVKYVRRDWLDRRTLALREWLRSIIDWLETENGILLEVECPHCQHANPVSDVLEFGKIYELTCSSCRNKFIVLIPAMVIRKGMIEAVIHGEPGNQS